MKHKLLIEDTEKGQALVIYLDGELDHHSARPLREAIDSELKLHPCKRCIIDMKNVSFMDSSGLGVILGRYRIITENGGKLSIRYPNKAVDRILRLSGIYSIVDVSKKA